MSRLPFDPKKMKPVAPVRAEARGSEGATVEPNGADRPLRVSELAALIDRAVRAGVKSPVRVVGEVSNFKDRTHWWFALKDAEAVVDCVMFAAAAKRMGAKGFIPANGQSVIATGRVEHYAAQGRTQLYVDRLEAVGVGALELKYRALVEELRGLGYFDPARKRALPWFSRRVAVVTSRTGAALQDVLDTMRRRCPAVDVALVDVRVQGAEASEEIARALAWLSKQRVALGIDALILTRGGGSMEDLWCFNERVVADAVLRCAIPIIAAIGHETDTTIAELVADERAATPTQAAMRLTPDRAGLAQQVEQTRRRLDLLLRGIVARHAELLRRVDPASALRRRLDGGHVRLERASARLARVRPEAVYAARRSALRELEARLGAATLVRSKEFSPDDAQRRLLRASQSRHKAGAERVAALARTLEVAGPMNVLRRGYSVTLRADGAVVREPYEVRAGETITTRLAAGHVRSIVEGGGSAPSVAPAQDRESSSPSTERPALPKRGRPKGAGPDQMDLFRGGE